MKRSSGSPLGLYTMGIAALFMVGFLLLVVFGAGIYQDAAATQEENNQSRALLSYILTCVKGSDYAESVTVRESDYGQVLEIADGSGYALHIYQFDGHLLEEYSAEDSLLNPRDAIQLGNTDVFIVERLAENTLRIYTDAGSVLLSLRSGEGVK